jgi:hypothetical protein
VVEIASRSRPSSFRSPLNWGGDGSVTMWLGAALHLVQAAEHFLPATWASVR